MPCCFLVVDAAASDEDLGEVGIDCHAKSCSRDPHAGKLVKLAIDNLMSVFKGLLTVDVFGPSNHEHPSVGQRDHSVHEIFGQLGCHLTAAEVKILVWSVTCYLHGL